MDSQPPMPGPMPGTSAPHEPTRSRGRRHAVEIVETLALTVVLFLVIQNFVAQPFKVEGHSMDRTFAPGDYVLVDRLTPAWSAYARGQVVVFHPPAAIANGTEPFIKRIIGTAGDSVEIRDGRVFVNRVALDEPYVFRDADGREQPTEAGDSSAWTVPDGELFVLGDHRRASEDSRVFGTIPVSSVVGRGVVRYWPLSAFGVVTTATYDDVPAP